MSTSPAEHGFRKISAPLGQSVPPKIRSPLPQADVKLYKCIMCGFLAESASLLGRHAFEMHEKRSKKWRIGQKCPVRHECEECDYETPDIHRLHRHMQRVHDTDQVFHFQCKECDFVATSADLLGRHALEVHEAGSVFRCSLCDFTSNRTGHLRTVKKKPINVTCVNILVLNQLLFRSILKHTMGKT